MQHEQEFLEKIAEILEVERELISMATDFRLECEDWDSMKGFSIIVMLEDDYNIFVEVPDFLACRSIGDLYARVQS